MKTLLSQFCEQFEAQLRPLLFPLDGFLDDLSRLPEKTPVRGVLPGLLDVRHELTTLADKVARQQAYVIIFGPLKSGKSTLMNAISADYVSEVTSLPAYPCMVYVSHGEAREIVITRYDGTTESFSELASMRMLMADAHAELSEKIREVEKSGADFEPSLHMPRAIRRVDVKMPAEQLAESGAVLVDTPGLYSRMKFGYDLMTREFRDEAASAIFVVKTDNLFLEQVFEEFNELLRLFSRIFLVVNLDTTKQDLQPDGGLGPSLERQDPQRIIEAFEKLSMNAELKAAWEEGRLSIYPVDLLQAAARRLKSGEAANGESLTEDFGTFMTDLTDYLNSTEYLVAFLGDSLRQGRSLVGEVVRLGESDVVRGLSRQVDELESAHGRATALHEAAQRLRRFEWDGAFRKLHEDIASITTSRIEALRADTLAKVDAVVDGWFGGDDGFTDLVEDLGGVLMGCRDEVVQTAHGVVKTVVGGETAGASLPDEVARDVETLDLSLGRIGRQSLDAIRLKTSGKPDALAIPPGVVPVRKGLLDWLLFRSRARVRQNLLGPDRAPDRTVPASLKRNRLGDAARAAIDAELAERLDGFFRDYLERVSSKIYKAYVQAVAAKIAAQVESAREDAERRVRDAENRLAELGRTRDDLQRLMDAVGSVGRSIEELSQRYGATDPSLLRAPVDEDGAGGDEVIEVEVADGGEESSAA